MKLLCTLVLFCSFFNVLADTDNSIIITDHGQSITVESCSNTSDDCKVIMDEVVSNETLNEVMDEASANLEEECTRGCNVITRNLIEAQDQIKSGYKRAKHNINGVVHTTRYVSYMLFHAAKKNIENRMRRRRNRRSRR